MSMRTNHFSRPTLAAALDLLERSMSQAMFGRFAFKLYLQDSVPDGDAISLGKKLNFLAKHMVSHGDNVVSMLDGQMTLNEAVVREAVTQTTDSPRHEGEQGRFVRALALDGFVIQWTDANGNRVPPIFRAALPGEVNLPATDDEVHQLLAEFGFNVPKGHLDQAIEAHTRGDWAAANGQARTFLESVFDAIAINLDEQRASSLASSENRRRMLLDVGFFSAERHEWNTEAKGFINGLFKMLHTEGAHPGLSGQNRSTFRLHLVLITACTFLRRLKQGSGADGA